LELNFNNKLNKQNKTTDKQWSKHRAHTRTCANIFIKLGIHKEHSNYD